MSEHQFEYMGWVLRKVGAIDGSVGMYAVALLKEGAIDGSDRTLRIGERLYNLSWEELINAPEFPPTFYEATREKTY